MIVIPVNTNDQTVIVLIIGKENLGRMAMADPITLTSSKLGGLLKINYPDNCRFIVAYEEDQSKIIELSKKNDVVGIIEYIHRGYTDISGLDGVQIPVDTETEL